LGQVGEVLKAFEAGGLLVHAEDTVGRAARTNYSRRFFLLSSRLG
jgi:hypothetical protein